MNNCSIPSTHAERKITVHSHKHSFTPYPSLSPYRQTDRMTDRGTNTLAVRGLEELFFQLCCCVSFLSWREIGFGFTYLCMLLNKLFYKLFGGFLCQSNYNRKKRYSRLAIIWNVWGFHQLGLFWQVPRSNYNQKKKVQSSGHCLQCWIVLAGLSLYFFAGSSIKLQITTGKKVQLSGSLTPFATHVTFYFYYVCT